MCWNNWLYYQVCCESWLYDMIYRICTICDLYSFSFGSFAAFCPIIFTFTVDSVEKRICLKEISRGRMIFHIPKKEGERQKFPLLWKYPSVFTAHPQISQDLSLGQLPTMKEDQPWFDIYEWELSGTQTRYHWLKLNPVSKVHFFGDELNSTSNHMQITNYYKCPMTTNCNEICNNRWAKLQKITKTGESRVIWKSSLVSGEGCQHVGEMPTMWKPSGNHPKIPQNAVFWTHNKDICLL